MKKIAFLAISAFTLIAVSCTDKNLLEKDIPEALVNNPDFVCDIVESDDTTIDPESKATLNYNEGDNSYSVFWEETDYISITDGTGIAKYKAKKGGSRRTTFTYVSGDQLKVGDTVQYVAGYPYTLIQKYMDGSVIYSFLPDHDVDDVSTLHDAPMMAKSDPGDKQLRFFNTGSLLKVVVQRSEAEAIEEDIHVNNVEITSNRSLAGHFSVTWQETEEEGTIKRIPSVVVENVPIESTKRIRYYIKNPVTIQTGGEQLVLSAVIPSGLYNDFNVTVSAVTSIPGERQSSTGQIKLQTGKSVNFERSKHYQLKKPVRFEFVNISGAYSTNNRNVVGNCIMIADHTPKRKAIGPDGQFYSVAVLNNGNSFWTEMKKNPTCLGGEISPDDMLIANVGEARETDRWRVEILWQDRINSGKPLIEFQSMEYPSKYSKVFFGAQTLIFRPVAEGNTIIGIRKLNPKTHEWNEHISWSYHIWAFKCHDAELANFAVQYSLNDYAASMKPMIMRRNLGATTINQDGDENSLGMLYQWGRKDPFPSRPGHFFTVDESGNVSPGDFERREIGTAGHKYIWYSVIHPTIFMENWDAFTEIYNAINVPKTQLWNNPGISDLTPGPGEHALIFSQNLYDPSPLGCGVPGWHTYQNATVNTSLPSGNGYHLMEPGAVEFHPATGYLLKDGSYHSSLCPYWSDQIANNTTGWTFCFYKANGVPTINPIWNDANVTSTATGMPIRPKILSNHFNPMKMDYTDINNQ